MKSNKAFTFENVGGETKTRVLVPESAARYNPDIHFMFFEESDYLEHALKGVPYATYTTDSNELMEHVLENGYADSDGTIWRSFFAFWKDQEGHAFLCPENANIKDARDVGIYTHMETPADFMKVGKYANRLLAALPKKLYGGTSPAWGDEVDWLEEEQTSLVQVEPHGDLTAEDCLLSIRYVNLKTLNNEQKALADGCIAVNEKAVRALGLSDNPSLGMAWRGTFGTQRGLGKGHILFVPGLEHEVVIYGPKTILKTERFFFGSMGTLHAGIPHTDRQAVVNFHLHRFIVELAKKYMRNVVRKSKNESELRQLFLTHTKDLSSSSLDQEGWVLRRALAYGISYLVFPGLFRRVVRYLMMKVMQCDERARIPLESDDYSIAKYGYVLPDINTIDKDGNIHPENGIPEGTIVFPDLPAGTKVVCYRQPSENTNAWVALTVVEKPEFANFAGRGICLLGRGADKVLARLGGGDMDDQFVIVHDPEWVAGFHTMRPYPETQKLSAEVSSEDMAAYNEHASQMSAFTEELLEDVKSRNLTHYTNKHVHWQIDMARNSRAGIGPVVNYGMMDLLLSDPDHKESMLADLATNPEAWEWLDKREPYQASLFMTNLELIIDGNVKDSTLLQQLGDVSGAIRDFHKECEVYPASLAGNIMDVLAERVPESKLRSRIPRKRALAGGFVLARSLTCKALASITELRDLVKEIFIEREWALVRPADKDLRQYYPYERELSIRVRGEWIREEDTWVRVDESESLLDMWANGFREATERGLTVEQAYKPVCDRILAELQDEDDEMMERLAVELYYQQYKTYQSGPGVDATGAIRSYPDGLLWSPIFGNHFINALRKARMTGFYKPATLFPEFIKRLRDVSVAVELRDFNLYIQDAHDHFTVHVGWLELSNSIAKVLNGEHFRMDNGLVEIRRPNELCLPKDEMMIAQQPLTRVIKSKVVPEVVVKKEGVMGTIAGVLAKALNVLK